MSRLPHATSVDTDAPGAAEKLLGIVRQTVLELRPHAAEGAPIGLHSVLDRDLGLDSLARVELWSRIEREFGVRLPEALFATADTPHDLLEFCAPRPTGRRPNAARRAHAGHPRRGPAHPSGAETLMEVLDWHVRQHPQRCHVRLLGDGDAVEAISHLAPQQGATAVAAGLVQRSAAWRPGSGWR
ncbi:acyl carrier protein [Pseudomonas lalucatii]|uniref:acyl carrier protein n=1 Tax=Pseudomonas lalucatii TaxID=1424203 RepID=UPI001BCB4FDB|nr:acyl carrier protein [Pseudomonas lalucatii]